MAVLDWLDIAFSLNNPLDYDAFVKACESKGVIQKLTATDYWGRIRGTQQVMARDNHTNHQLAYENIYTLNRGVGDTIAKITHALGITPCGGCQKRQEELNRIVPYE
jgi:hypothetical protein